MPLRSVPFRASDVQDIDSATGKHRSKVMYNVKSTLGMFVTMSARTSKDLLSP
jgi:hypothetical protein